MNTRKSLYVALLAIGITSPAFAGNYAVEDFPLKDSHYATFSKHATPQDFTLYYSPLEHLSKNDSLVDLFFVPPGIQQLIIACSIDEHEPTNETYYQFGSRMNAVKNLTKPEHEQLTQLTGAWQRINQSTLSFTYTNQDITTEDAAALTLHSYPQGPAESCSGIAVKYVIGDSNAYAEWLNDLKQANTAGSGANASSSMPAKLPLPAGNSMCSKIDDSIRGAYNLATCKELGVEQPELSADDLEKNPNSSQGCDIGINGIGASFSGALSFNFDMCSLVKEKIVDPVNGVSAAIDDALKQSTSVDIGNEHIGISADAQTK